MECVDCGAYRSAEDLYKRGWFPSINKYNCQFCGVYDDRTGAA